MSLVQALLAYSLAAGLLTITPGLDTALVLRTVAVEGRRAALFAASGIELGLLVWGAIVALGLGALLLASPMVFAALKWTGAAYLVVLGVRTFFAPRARFDVGAPASAEPAGSALRRGLLTNLLNPKVGIFYVSFLPQFVPAGVTGGPFMFALALIHVAIGAVWLSLLIAGAHQARILLGRPKIVRALDRVAGGIFVAFGLKLALSSNN